MPHACIAAAMPDPSPHGLLVLPGDLAAGDPAALYPLTAILLAGLGGGLLATWTGAALARAGFPLPDPARRTGCLDGLRGYLALCVMLHHGVIWLQIIRLGGGWDAPRVNLLNQLGAGSVALFFMATGLLFYPRIRAGFAATDWTATYILRACRILPLTILSVALVAALIAWRTGAHPRLHDAGAALQWTIAWDEPPLLGEAQARRLNADVLWSLRCEWLFYLCLLPACALLQDALRRLLPASAAAAALLPCLLFGLPPIAARHVAGGVLLNSLPLFALGMLAAECHALPALRRRLAARWMALPALAALLFAMLRAPTPYSTPELALYGAFFVIIACGNDLFGLLRTRGAQVLGACSFGIYLLHGLVLALLFQDVAGRLASWPTGWLALLLLPAAPAVVLAAAAAHLLVERPCLRAGAAFARTLRHHRRLPRGHADRLHPQSSRS